MKKFFNIAFLFLLVVSLVTSAAAPVLGAANQSGRSAQPYWYSVIDATGTLIDELDDLYQNSAQYTIFNSAGTATYILSAHPNYAPDGDDQTTAQTTTLVTAIQAYDPNDAKVNAAVAGTFQAPSNYIRITTANVPYLKFAVTFTTYNNQNGAIVSTNTFDPVYFNLNSVTPPAPTEPTE
jgi:hypothetical protein